MRLATLLSNDQRRTLDCLSAAIERLWEHPVHHYFTDQGVTHSKRIRTLLGGLTVRMMQTASRLSPTEAFVLLVATYLHDAGMQDERFAGSEIQEVYAHYHEQTAATFYRIAEDPQNAIPASLRDNPALVQSVLLVTMGHRRTDLASSRYDQLHVDGETLRLRLLAALLRFAEELDADHRRVDLERMERLNLPVLTRLTWWTRHYVARVNVVNETVRVTYHFPKERPGYKRLIVPLVEGEIRANLAKLEPILRAHTVRIALDAPQVQMRPTRPVWPMPEDVEALAQKHLEERQAPKALVPDYSTPPPPGLLTPERSYSQSAHTERASGPERREISPIAALRPRLQRLDVVEIEALCLDHFPQVYDKFARGMRRDEMINLLLNHCRLHPAARDRLDELLQQGGF